jgi:hypothetical protein
VDRTVISAGAVRVRFGDLAFQTPEAVGYVPFPLAFTCRRCGLHRQCQRLDTLERDFGRFRDACPTGAAKCANDWQQIDVVMAHWSGEIEALTPAHRRWQSATASVIELSNCSSCGANRFYLRRPPGPFAGWHFECVACHSNRRILQRDRQTLELLGPLLDQNRAYPAEINMEPVSYRASAVHYTHGDRLLVFGEDRWLGMLGGARTAELESFLATEYGYPAAALSDADKERILRENGLAGKWADYVGTRNLLQMMETATGVTPEMLAGPRGLMAETEARWNETVFAGQQQAAPGIHRACAERQGWVRRQDPVRMAAEHKTLAEEKLHGGAMQDGKAVSVDVRYLDPFLRPDGFTPAGENRMRAEVEARLGLLGIAEMRLVRDVRVCEYTFGYTRTSSAPTVRRDKLPNAELPVRLRLFGKVRVGDGAAHPVLCIEQSNEGFYVRLNEASVIEWLDANGVPLPPAAPGVRLGGRLIEDFATLQNDPALRFTRFFDEYRREHAVARRAYPFVYTLLHTAAHHLTGVASSMSGLDLGSFGEHLFVPDLAFLVYRRGTTMDLGNLSSMWRERGDLSFGNEVLDRMADPASLRCGSESVCNHRGGACPDCVLLPEATCITRNDLLSRSVLVGRGAPRWDAADTPLTGYYEVAARRLDPVAAP